LVHQGILMRVRRFTQFPKNSLISGKNSQIFDLRAPILIGVLINIWLNQKIQKLLN